MTTASNILVGSGGAVYVAPVGTALPTSPTSALNAAFVSVGYISEDGIGLSSSVDVSDIGAFQSLLPVRRVVTGRTFDVSFTMREWTAQNIVLAFGGGEVTEDTGVFTYSPPDTGEALYERSMVIEWNDGDKDYRIVIERGVVAEAVETNVTRTSAAELPITFSVLGNDAGTDAWYLVTDDPALNPA